MENMIIAVLLSMNICLLLLRQHCRRMASNRRRRAAYLQHMAIRGAHSRVLMMRRSHLSTGFLHLAQEGAPRRWWVYPRSNKWWNTYVALIWEDEQWLEHFRMTRATLFWLVDVLRPHLERQDTNIRCSIPVDERVAIAIWWLANTLSYRLLGQQFGLARSTVAEIVIEVCLALEMELLSTVIRPGPTAQVMRGFSALGFPHCVGAMDGCHIAVRAPAGLSSAFINRKDFCSVLLQATVDHRGRFVDVAVGSVGRDHDAHVLHRSHIIDAMDAGVWVPGNPTVTIEGVQIPPLIVADAA